ncbi:unnamed protein product [Protopolystoma xenopodis]|uniref:Uncharacterized protein n=1 Tax=Protopolystoma xenopodis TaxID=117903 RepID=A0A3S5BBT5_9PLAT|nr:unnamed protein product [Protopolystoma xenopodis]
MPHSTHPGQITLTSSDDSTDPQDPESLSAVDLSNLFFEAASDVHFKARTSDCGPSFLATCMRRLIANILAADSAAKIDEGLSTSLAISSGSKMASKSNQLADLANRAVGFQCSLERRFGCSLEPEKQGCLSKTSDVSGELLVSEVDWDSEDAPVIVNE